MNFDDYCKDNDIITLCMPSHSSYRLQSLNLISFSVLKRLYSVFVEDLMCRHQTYVAKKDFLAEFLKTFTDAFTEQNIRSDFKTAELVSLDANRVISALDVIKAVKTPSPNSELPLLT